MKPAGRAGVGQARRGAARRRTQAIAAYARQRGDSLEIQQAASEVKLRAERRMGELLQDMPKQSGGDAARTRSQSTTEYLPPPTLSQLGIPRDLSSRCQSIARLPEGDFEAFIEGACVAGETLSTAAALRTARAAAGGGTGGTNEWYTPRPYVEAARRVMGGIDLDPASSPRANAVVGAGRFYTEADDGLTLPWAGRLWLNPPYSSPAVDDFVRRAVAEYESGRVREAVILTNNCTDTAWFHHAAAAAPALCLTRGRISFWRDDPGAPAEQTRQGQAFFYLGKSCGAFAEEFRAFGLILSVRGGFPSP